MPMAGCHKPRGKYIVTGGGAHGADGKDRGFRGAAFARGGGLRGALAQPEEEVPGGDLAAVDGEHHGLAGDPALFAHHLLDGVLRGGAADAAAEHAHRHGQGKGGGQGFLYESVHRNDTPCVPIEMGFRGGKLSLHRGAFYHDFPFVTTLFPKIHGWFTGSSHLVDIFPAAA